MYVHAYSREILSFRRHLPLSLASRLAGFRGQAMCISGWLIACCGRRQVPPVSTLQYTVLTAQNCLSLSLSGVPSAST